MYGVFRQSRFFCVVASATRRTTARRQVKQPLCAAAQQHWVKYAIEDYQPKTVIDETRVEFVYDFLAFGGTEERPSATTGHYLHQELARAAGTCALRSARDIHSCRKR